MKKFVVPILAVAALAGIGFFIYKKKKSSKSTSYAPPAAQNSPEAACKGCHPDELAVLKSPTTEDMLSVIQSIKNTPEWLASVQEKAKQSGRSLDVQLKLDAAWFLKNQS